MLPSSLATLLLCALAVSLRARLVTGQPKINIGQITIEDQPVNEKRLFCEVTTNTDTTETFPNGKFYRNGDDLEDLLRGSEFRFEDTGDRRRIVFQLTQELEGVYTCGNGTFRSSDKDALTLVSRPTPDTNIDRYYAAPVGGVVKINCGIRQGALGELYSARWIRDSFETIVSSRFQIKRGELEDFTLTISPVAIADNSTFVCSVDIIINGQLQFFVESSSITLVVYEEPRITFLTEDQTMTVSATQTLTQQFICNATGGPHLEIYWKRNEELIPNNEKYSVHSMAVATDDHVMSVRSVLTITNPRLIDSGELYCVATIHYGSDSSTNVNDISYVLQAVRNTSDLIVLDSSLEPRPIPTQDNDLLVRIDLPPGAVISDEIRVRVRLTPEDDNDGEPLEMLVDGVFSDVSTFYPFIPASQLRFTQFYVQVLLVVNNVEGPLNPPTVTGNQFIDYDESDSFDRLIIVIIVISVAALLITLICVGIVIMFYMRYRLNKNERNIKEHVDHSCESVKETLRKELVKLNVDFTKTSDENAKETKRLINEIFHYKYLLESIKTLMEGNSQDKKPSTPNVPDRNRTTTAGVNTTGLSEASPVHGGTTVILVQPHLETVTSTRAKGNATSGANAHGTVVYDSPTDTAVVGDGLTDTATAINVPEEHGLPPVTPKGEPAASPVDDNEDEGFVPIIAKSQKDKARKCLDKMIKELTTSHEG